MKTENHHPIWYKNLYKRIFTKRMINVAIHRKYTCFSDLYTYQNAKNPRSVDNMVDNVDNPLWITHTVFVNKVYAFGSLTHGKLRLIPFFLQDTLQLR